MKFVSISASLIALLWLANIAIAESGAWQPVPNNGIINKPGQYSLQQDVNTDRTIGIKIEADNVTIDLCGHALRCAGEPKPGSYGIAAPDRTDITVTNGTIGGFWFNMHCTQNKKLRIRDIHFDDIPYIGINVAQSSDVVISENRFENFRYDVPKDEKSHYVVGINIGAKDAVITKNRFVTRPQMAAKDVDIETVFILFSAEVTKHCLVAKNDLEAGDVLPKSYGVWVANNAQVTVVDNTIRNMKFGVCLGRDASALVCVNRFDAASKSDPPIETHGISAASAKEILDVKNSFEGVDIPVTAPQTADDSAATGG